MEHKHGSKMVAPIVITAVLVLYDIGFFVLCVFMPLPAAVKLLFGVAPILLAGVSVYVLMERIREIRSGEEDDLGKY